MCNSELKRLLRHFNAIFECDSEKCNCRLLKKHMGLLQKRAAYSSICTSVLK